jgi:hypothetical protein
MSDELKAAVKEFFDYLDMEEESDGGRMFHPINISCCRVMLHERVNSCLEKMKELSK